MQQFLEAEKYQGALAGFGVCVGSAMPSSGALNRSENRTSEMASINARAARKSIPGRFVPGLPVDLHLRRSAARDEHTRVGERRCLSRCRREFLRIAHFTPSR